MPFLLVLVQDVSFCKFLKKFLVLKVFRLLKAVVAATVALVVVGDDGDGELL